MKPIGALRAVFVLVGPLLLQIFISDAQAADPSPGYIGITINNRETADAPLRIVSVASGSEAEKAGVKAPAYLLTVNGANVTLATMDAAVKTLRGPVGKTVEFETTDFDRQTTNKYLVSRGVRRSATNFASSWKSRKSVVVTTNDVIVATTKSGETATIQFLHFSPSMGGEDEQVATATYRIHFPIQNHGAATNLLKESYTSKRVGKITSDRWLTKRPDHLTHINLGHEKLEWSYKSSNGGHLAFDTNSVSVTLTNAASFPESSN